MYHSFTLMLPTKNMIPGEEPQYPRRRKRYHSGSDQNCPVGNIKSTRIRCYSAGSLSADDQSIITNIDPKLYNVISDQQTNELFVYRNPNKRLQKVYLGISIESSEDVNGKIRHYVKKSIAGLVGDDLKLRSGDELIILNGELISPRNLSSEDVAAICSRFNLKQDDFSLVTARRCQDADVGKCIDEYDYIASRAKLKIIDSDDADTVDGTTHIQPIEDGRIMVIKKMGKSDKQCVVGNLAAGCFMSSDGRNIVMTNEETKYAHFSVVRYDYVIIRTDHDGPESRDNSSLYLLLESTTGRYLYITENGTIEFKDLPRGIPNVDDLNDSDNDARRAAFISDELSITDDRRLLTFESLCKRNCFLKYDSQYKSLRLERAEVPKWRIARMDAYEMSLRTVQ